MAADLPEAAAMPGVEIIERDMVFETPYGETTKFKLVNIAGSYTIDGRDRLFLTNRMHGWRKGASGHVVPNNCSGFLTERRSSGLYLTLALVVSIHSWIRVTLSLPLTSLT